MVISEMNIRSALLQDIAEIEKFNKLLLQEERDYKRYLNDPNTLFLIAEEENKEMIGFTSATYSSWNNSVWLNQIVVHPNHRRKGVGSKLLAKIKEFAESRKARVILIECGLENKTAQFFYLKNNARICGYNDRYYPQTHDKGTAIFFSIDLVC
jgi:ribosomal protein S18 acetylase RimI-like enzyme